MKSTKMDTSNTWNTVTTAVAAVESSAVPTDALLVAKRALDIWSARQAKENERVRYGAELMVRDIAQGDADAQGADLPSLLAKIEAVRCSPYRVQEGLAEVGRLIERAMNCHRSYAAKRYDNGLPRPSTFPTASLGVPMVDAIRAAIASPAKAEDYSHQIMLAESEIRTISLARAKHAQAIENERKDADERAQWEQDRFARDSKRHAEEAAARAKLNAEARAADDALIAQYCPLH